MQKIALINGSPKNKNSASECLLEVLNSKITDSRIIEFNMNTPNFTDFEAVCENEILVFAFPLYVDGIPSHLLSCLAQLEQLLRMKQADICVYAIVNCGFFEGKQNCNALDMMENWCIKANVKWGLGIGIGGGGMALMLKSGVSKNGPLHSIVGALSTLAIHILYKESDENIYVSPNFPRILYKVAAEMGWRQQIKANGLKRKDLSLRI